MKKVSISILITQSPVDLLKPLETFFLYNQENSSGQSSPTITASSANSS